MAGPGLGASRYARGSSSLNSTPEPPRQPALSNVFSTPTAAATQPKPGYFATPMTGAASVFTPNAAMSSAAQVSASATNGDGFFATPSAPPATSTTKKENKPPAAKTSTIAARLAILRAAAEGNRHGFTSSQAGAAAAPSTTDAPASKVTIANSTQTHAQPDDKQDQSRVAELKAEEERRKAELHEAERRAKAQADLKAVLARIAELEAKEQDRLVTSTGDLANAKIEHDNVKAYLEETVKGKADNVRILQKFQEQLATIQAQIMELTKTIAANEHTIEEARALVDESGQELGDVESAHAAALAEHKDCMDVLLKDQTRLEQIIDGASPVDNVPDLSTSAAPSPQTLRAVTPMDEDEQVPVVVVKDEPVIKQEVVEDDFVAPAAVKAREVPSPAVMPNVWVKPILRKPSVIRTVNLTNLDPANTTIAYVTGLVWAGTLHSVKYTPGDTVATITFLRAEDCKKYIDDTKNGIQCPENGNRTIITQPSEVESGSLEHFDIMLANGHTRCVRVVAIDSDWKALALKKIAETGGVNRGATPRKVERLVNGHDAAKRRIVDFRFCKIADAVLFKNYMDRDEEFKDCHVSFTADPCASATGVHKGLM